MKSTRTKAISTLLLVCISLQAIPAQCADGIFFNYSTARKLYVDAATSQKAAVRLGLCDQDRTLLEQKANLLGQKVDGLQLDKAEYKKEAEQYKAEYIRADKAKVEAENSKPSRMRWFIIGFLTAAATAIAGTLATR